MPLFKFNLNATVMPSIEVDGTVELVIPHSDAEVAFPLFLVDGTMGAVGEALVPVLSVSGRMEGVSDGKVVFPLLSVDGFAAIPVQIEGYVSFPFLVAAGSMRAETSVDIPCLRVDGDASVEGIVCAEIGFPFLDVDGIVAVAVSINGDIIFSPCLQVFGDVFVAGQADADATITSLAVDGVVDVAVNVDGDVIFSPCLQVFSDVFVAGQFNGNVEFSLLVAEGSVTELPYSDCSVLLPPVAVDADAEVHIPAIISCDTSFPAIDVSGSMQAVGNVSVPMCGVDGSMQNFQYANCSVAFPGLFVEGSVSRAILSTIAGSVVFPKIQASGVVADQAITGHGPDSVLRYADDRRLI